MDRLLIFGAGGFVGRYLYQEFVDNGYKVILSDRRNPGIFTPDVEFKEVDILNAGEVEALIKSVCPDMIINLAAISSVGASWGIPQETMMVNVVGVLNILEAVKKHLSATKVMLIGSSEEYVISDFPMSEDRKLDATNPYGISKVTQEQFANMYKKHYGMKIYCVRSFNHTGIGQKESFVLPSWIKQIADIDKSGAPGVIKVGNLSVKRDFSHVKDIVRAYRLVIESDNCDLVYNIGSGKAYSLKEMLEYILSLSKQKVAVEIDKSRFRPSDQPVICCDHSLITSQLGWEPELTVFDALKEMYEFNMLNGE